MFVLRVAYISSLIMLVFIVVISLPAAHSGSLFITETLALFWSLLCVCVVIRENKQGKYMLCRLGGIDNCCLKALSHLE